jgi:hypothetical protein
MPCAAARAAKSRMPWASEVRNAAGSATWRVARSCGTSSRSRFASATSGFRPTSGIAASAGATSMPLVSDCRVAEPRPRGSGLMKVRV